MAIKGIGKKIDITKPELSAKFIIVLFLLIIVITFVVGFGKSAAEKLRKFVGERIPRKDSSAEYYSEELGL